MKKNLKSKSRGTVPLKIPADYGRTFVSGVLNKHMKSSHGEKKTARGPNKPKKKRLLAPRVESTTFCKTETDALMPDHQIQAMQVTQLLSLQLFSICISKVYRVRSQGADPLPPFSSWSNTGIIS
jgi:hypothetical protein